MFSIAGALLYPFLPLISSYSRLEETKSSLSLHPVSDSRLGNINAQMWRLIEFEESPLILACAALSLFLPLSLVDSLSVCLAASVKACAPEHGVFITVFAGSYQSLRVTILANSRVLLDGSFVSFFHEGEELWCWSKGHMCGHRSGWSSRPFHNDGNNIDPRSVLTCAFLWRRWPDPCGTGWPKGTCQNRIGWWHFLYALVS